MQDALFFEHVDVINQLLELPHLPGGPSAHSLANNPLDCNLLQNIEKRLAYGSFDLVLLAVGEHGHDLIDFLLILEKWFNILDLLLDVPLSPDLFVFLVTTIRSLALISAAALPVDLCLLNRGIGYFFAVSEDMQMGSRS